MATVSALETKLGSLGRHDRGTDDNTWYTDQSGDCERVQVPDRNIFGVRVQEKLVGRKVDFFDMRKHGPLCAFSQGSLKLETFLSDEISTEESQETYQRYDFSGFCDKAMRQLFVILDEVADIDITVVSLQERILAQLISVTHISAMRSLNRRGVAPHL